MSSTDLQRRTVDVGASTLSYSVCGEGQPLVLIHGWAGFWEHILSVIQTTPGFRLYAFDMPGWQHAEALRGGNSLETFNLALAEALDALSIEGPVHPMGQSMGAVSALLFADRFPQRVGKLVLVSPPFSLLRDGPNRRLLRWGIRTALDNRPILSIMSRAHKTRWYNYWITRQTAFYEYDPWFFEEVILPSARVCDEETSLSHTLSMFDIDVWSMVRRVAHPTAIIVGDRDPVISVNEARMAAQLFQRGELFVIQRAKHAIMMERAVELCEATFHFLSDAPAPSHSTHHRSSA
ncbi:MAG: alpha/beta hydrolase [Anaerolineae bacterium]